MSRSESPLALQPSTPHPANRIASVHTGIDPSVPAANEAPRGRRIDPTHHLDFVRRLAMRMARSLPAHVCVDDLVGAGTLGLLEALDRYDPEKSDRFETFAEFRIKGAMLDELRRHDLMARSARLTKKRIAQMQQQLTARLGRPPEEEEMASAMQLSLDDFHRLLARVGNVQMLSLDDTSSPDDGGRTLQLRDSVPSPEEVASIDESHDRLRRALAKLPQRQQMILEMYYQREMTLKEIGSDLGVTESRICQIVGEATGRLRKLMNVAPPIAKNTRSSGRTRAAS